MKYNVYISPTVIGINESEEHSPLMAHIKKEGIELWRRPT
jgi:lipoate-protein ligase A